jgi:hypothetical protein
MWAVAAAALGACGADTASTPDPKPATAVSYSTLPDTSRVAAAAGCRDRAAARASGLAARQLADVDEQLLQRRLDIAVEVDGAVPFEQACADALPLVTPGLRVRFAGVTGNGIEFSYPTRSDRPLTIRGSVSPAPAGGRVVARREVAPRRPMTAPIDAQGRFVFRDIRLRKMADNTFLLAIEAPPNAPRLVRLSALCMDCVISGSPPPGT